MFFFGRFSPICWARTIPIFLSSPNSGRRPETCSAADQRGLRPRPLFLAFLRRSGRIENSPAHSQGHFGPFGPEVPLRVSERVSPKIGVCPKVSGKVPLGPFQSGLKVSKRCLCSHFKATFWTHFGPGLKGSLEHSLRHSQAHPAFRGHSLSGTSGGTSGPKGPKTLVGGRVFLNGRTPTMQIVRGMGATERLSCNSNLKGAQFLLQGPRFPSGQDYSEEELQNLPPAGPTALDLTPSETPAILI